MTSVYMEVIKLNNCAFRRGNVGVVLCQCLPGISILAHCQILLTGSALHCIHVFTVFKCSLSTLLVM